MDITHLIRGLNACGLRYETVDLDGGWKLLVSAHGGHIYGPFSPRCPEGLCWMPSAVQEEERFRELVESGSWNTGGDRVWIAPEIQFNIMDRSRYRETLKTPGTIDPGTFRLSSGDNAAVLEQRMELEAHNTVLGAVNISLKRTVRSAPNPLRKLPDYYSLMEGIDYCGYEQVLDLESSGDRGIYAEAWDLHQIRPGGLLFIPMYHVERGVDHYEPAGDMEFCTSGGACLWITGNSRYKIAYRSANLTGRMGYLADLDAGGSYLIIKAYPNNPSCMYSEEPPLSEGDTGYSIHVYNDDGSQGGFAEMECNMQTIGEPTGLSHAIDRLETWMYVGAREKLGILSERLLGTDVAKIEGRRDFA